MFSSSIGLSEDGPCSISRHIDLEGVGFRRVQLVESRVSEYGRDEGVEGDLALWCPGEGMVLFSEFCEGSCYVHVLWYKGSLITKNTEYAANFLDCFEFMWPVA